MKFSIPILIVALLAAECSPKTETVPSQPKKLNATGHGITVTYQEKPETYYKSVYGAPKSEKHVQDYACSVPGHGSLVYLTRPLLVQQYENDRLKVTVVCSETTRQAIWISYQLPGEWTQEQINGALKAYGSDWTIADQKPGMSLVLGNLAGTLYRSSAGVLAYKSMTFSLIVYTPQLYADLISQIEELERQKKAVPKF